MSSTNADRVAATIAELDRLGVSVSAGRSVARAALQAVGRGVSTAVLRGAISARKQRVGIVGTSRRKPARKEVDRPRRASLPPLLAAMFDGRLVGAACVGRHELFDDELDNAREDAAARAARHAAAAQICCRCRVLTSCRVVAAELGDKAHGVWAARIPAGRTSRREEDR